MTEGPNLVTITLLSGEQLEECYEKITSFEKFLDFCEHFAALTIARYQSEPEGLSCKLLTHCAENLESDLEYRLDQAKSCGSSIKREASANYQKESTKKFSHIKKCEKIKALKSRSNEAGFVKLLCNTLLPASRVIRLLPGDCASISPEDFIDTLVTSIRGTRQLLSTRCELLELEAVTKGNIDKELLQSISERDESLESKTLTACNIVDQRNQTQILASLVTTTAKSSSRSYRGNHNHKSSSSGEGRGSRGRRGGRGRAAHSDNRRSAEDQDDE